MKILNKVEDPLTNQIDELYLRTAITQLEKKRDLVLEKINELNKQVETLSREDTVPVLSP